VEGYTGRDLTFPGDKIKAIAALAELYRIRTNRTYLAGLWKESLLSDLCWVVLSKMLRPRPRAYRAPSWSWAAIDTEVVYTRYLHESPIVDTDADATVVNVILHQQPPNTTHGQIYSAYLILEGYIAKTEWHYNGNKYALLFPTQGNTLSTWQDAIETDWTLSRDSAIPVTVLILTRHTEKNAKEIKVFLPFGLILVEVSPKLYKRVGTCESVIRLEQGTNYDFATSLRELGFEKRKVTII
jgi:hypothetical protein